MKIIGNSLFGVGIAISTLSSLAAGQSAEHAVNRTPARWILIYGGGPTGVYPPYTVDSFIDLVAAVDSAGHPIAWLTTGALFLELYSSSGHLFTPWIGGTRARANGADWRVYLDSLYSPGGLLDRLDSAVSIVAKAVGPRSTPYRVAVMLPYPASSPS